MIGEQCSVRLRHQGTSDVETRRAPFVQSGRLTAVVEDADGEVVVMQVGPTKMEFFIADFAGLFQGYDPAQRLLRDAVQHQDFVEIRVLRDRLSYYNEAQYARVSQPDRVEVA
jgi:hypothetical protein